MMDQEPRSLRRLWLGPLLFAAMSAAALMLALIYDGWPDIACGLVLLGVGTYGLRLLTRRD